VVLKSIVESIEPESRQTAKMFFFRCEGLAHEIGRGGHDTKKSNKCWQHTMRLFACSVGATIGQEP